MKNTDGFTLLELITILFILGMLCYLAIPALISSEQIILESTAQRMVQDIRWAQQLAIHTGKNHNFEIHLTEKYYYIRSENPNELSLKKVRLNDSIESITSTLASAGYGGSFTQYRILSYSPTGIPSQTGTIILKTKSGKEIKITIAVATGRVMIVR